MPPSYRRRIKATPLFCSKKCPSRILLKRWLSKRSLLRQDRSISGPGQRAGMPGAAAQVENEAGKMLE